MYEQYLNYPHIPCNAVLKRIMQKERLSQRELARRSGIVPQRINDLLSERRRITADMSIKLEKALGIPHAGYFYIIQANHDVYLVEKQLQTHPIANTFRKELFWDTDKSGLDWVSNRQWIIQRVFEYGNDKEILATIEFYGKATTLKTLRDIKSEWKKETRLANIKNFWNEQTPPKHHLQPSWRCPCKNHADKCFQPFLFSRRDSLVTTKRASPIH